MKRNLILSLLLLAALTACEKKVTPPKNDGQFLICTTLPNPDGMSGSAYMQLVNELNGQKIDNQTAIPIPFSTPIQYHQNDIYVMPDVMGKDKNVMIRYRVENNTLIAKGELELPAQSRSSNVAILNDSKGYLSMSNLGRIMVFNPTTMQKIKEIDLTDYAEGDQNPDPAGLIIRGGILYVGLTQVTGFFPDPDNPYADVLLIDVANDEVIKKIREEKSGFSMPTTQYDQNSIFKDEKGDIYVICFGGFGYIPNDKHSAGILRIKANATEFDEHYQFNLSKQIIEGEPNLTNYITWAQYAGNGKVYAFANIPAYYSNPRQVMTDLTMISVEVDIYNQTMKRIDIPAVTTFYAQSTGTNSHLVYFGGAQDGANGFFSYDIKTGKRSENLLIKVTGTPYGIHVYR